MIRLQSTTDRKLPVIILPDELIFYVDDRSTHKQTLTLFNPYDIPLNYKVFCSASEKYIIDNPQGSLKPKCRIDIPVRHTAAFLHNCNTTDKFRIQVYERLLGASSHSATLGRKDVLATLIASRSDESDSSKSREIERPPKPSPQQSRKQHDRSSHRLDQSSTPSSLVMIAAVMCIIALMLPTVDEKQLLSDSFIPVYFHLTSTKKLVASYVLGILTVVFVIPYIS